MAPGAGGTGYIPPVTVTIAGGGGVNATATANLKTWDNKTADLPLKAIWRGHNGWTWLGRYLKVPQDPAANEMME